MELGTSKPIFSSYKKNENLYDEIFDENSIACQGELF